MSSNLLISIVTIADFAIGASGLIVLFFVPSKPVKQTLVALCIFLFLTSGLLIWHKREEKSRIRAVAEEIVNIIGNEKKTIEEILSGLQHPDYRVANAAIELLLNEKRIGSQVTTITDKNTEESHFIRLYFVRTFGIQ